MNVIKAHDKQLPVESAGLTSIGNKRIIVPLDGSELAEHALPLAESLAQAQGGILELVHILEEPVMLDLLPSLAIPNRLAAEQYLRSVAARIDATDVRTFTVRGNPAEELIRATNGDPDTIIVMSTHGRGGLGRVVFGSVADKVVRGAAVPVVLIRDGMPLPRARLATLLVPLDGSMLSEEALPLALELARGTDATISLVRVVDPFWTSSFVAELPEAPYLSPSQIADVEQQSIADARQYLDLVATDLRARDVRVVWEVRIGRPADEITRAAETMAADLVLLSTHGRGGFRRWALGSVMNEVVHAGQIPVLAIPPKVRERDMVEMEELLTTTP